MPKDSRALERLPLLAEILAPARRTRVVEVAAHPIDQNPCADLRDAGFCDVRGGEPNPVAFARHRPGPHGTCLPVAVGDGTAQPLHATRGTAFSFPLPPLLDAQMARLRGHGLNLHTVSHLEAFSLRGGAGAPGGPRRAMTHRGRPA